MTIGPTLGSSNSGNFFNVTFTCDTVVYCHLVTYIITYILGTYVDGVSVYVVLFLTTPMNLLINNIKPQSLEIPIHVY